MIAELAQWMDSVSGTGWFWFAKRLAGNDTLLNGAHQAGPYVPKRHAFRLFPSLGVRRTEVNPRVRFDAHIDSHDSACSPSCIYYNSATRDECRFTSWGGQQSPILNPDATGSICVFAFEQTLPSADARLCRVWLCESVEEEDSVEGRLGPIEPGEAILYDAGGATLFPLESSKDDAPCWLSASEMPDAWMTSFPTAAEIVSRAVVSVPSVRAKSPDLRLMSRRTCEFAIFRSLEQYHVLPRLREGFATVDLFVDFANRVTNRRKSRSGSSLELQAKTIFDEERLPYSYDQISEQKKRPDFLFPSAAAYHDARFDPNKLRMLAVKTTCKDRWRQILNEAERITRKHLLTLQEGVSLAQYQEMKACGVCLVVPQVNKVKFPRQIRDEIGTLEQFILETRSRCT